VYLASDAAKGVSGQVIGARGNEIMLYAQHRLVRTLHRADGFTPARIAEMLPGTQAVVEPLVDGRAQQPWAAM
jgi:hypothetical protein